MSEMMKIEDALESAWSRVEAGERMSAVVLDYPEHSGELERLLTCSQVLTDSLRQVKAPAAFRQAAWARLLQAIAAAAPEEAVLTTEPAIDRGTAIAPA